jgi:hypothetical protein
MKRLKKFIISGLVSIIALMFLSIPVFADVGLKVEGAIFEQNVAPGNIYIHKMLVKSYDNYPDMEVDVKPYGLGQKLDGGYEALPGNMSDTQFSAFDYITRIENMSFHLPPGGEQEVLTTIDIPSATENLKGGRYAVLHIKPTLETKNSFVFIPSIYVPVVLNFGSWDLSGEITDLTMGNAVSGKPIECLVALHNTGNYHYRANCTAIIKDAMNNVVNETISPYTTVSLIPGYSYLFKVEISPAQGLPKGPYSVTCATSLEDGTVLDTDTTSFEVAQNYIRFLDEQNETPYAMNWAFIGGTIVFIMAGAFIILMLMRRRRYQ